MQFYFREVGEKIQSILRISSGQTPTTFESHRITVKQDYFSTRKFLWTGGKQFRQSYCKTFNKTRERNTPTLKKEKNYFEAIKKTRPNNLLSRGSMLFDNLCFFGPKLRIFFAKNPRTYETFIIKFEKEHLSRKSFLWTRIMQF